MAAIRAVLRAAGPKKAARDDKGTGSASLSSGPFSDPDGNSIRGAFFEHLPSFVDVDEEAGLTSALSYCLIKNPRKLIQQKRKSFNAGGCLCRIRLYMKIRKRVVYCSRTKYHIHIATFTIKKR